MLVCFVAVQCVGDILPSRSHLLEYYDDVGISSDAPPGAFSIVPPIKWSQMTIYQLAYATANIVADLQGTKDMSKLVTMRMDLN